MAVSNLHRVPLRRCEEPSCCDAARMLSLFQEFTLSILKCTFGITTSDANHHKCTN